MPNLLEMADGGGIGSMAAGPAGVILIGRDGVDGRPFVIRSTDGETWARTELADETFGGGIPSLVVSGGPGYVAIGYEVALSAVAGSDPVVWLSADGVGWIADPSASGWLRGMYVARLAGLPDGSLFASLGQEAREGCCGEWLMSKDGAEWQTAALPVEHPTRYETGPGGIVVSTELEPADDLTFATTTRAWYASGLGSWRELPALEAPWIDGGFSPIDFVVGDSILAVDRNTQSVLEENWSFDIRVLMGDVWQRVRSPFAPFQPDESVLIEAGPTGGFVTLRMRDREPAGLWLSSDGIGWEEQPLDSQVWGRTHGCGYSPALVWLGDRPIIRLCDAVTGDAVVVIGRPDVHRDVLTHATVSPMPPPGPSPERIEPACPETPRTIRDLADLPPGAGPRCFGDRPISVRAWQAESDFDPPAGPVPCGEWWDRDPGERWMLDGCRNYIFAVGPGWETTDDLLYVTVHPSANAPRRGGWYRVTGHFDDPAAAGCGAPTTSLNVPQFEPSAAWVNGCRATFVGTEFVRL